MPNQSGLNLEATYTVAAASYSYATLSLVDSLADAQQIAVFVDLISVTNADGDTLAVDLLPLEDQQLIRILSEQFVTVDPITQSVSVVDFSGSTVPGAPQYIYLPFVLTTAEPLSVRRSTNISNPVVDFQPGSRLTSAQLTAANTQNLNSIQELTANLAELSLGTPGPIGPAGPEGPVSTVPGPPGPVGGENTQDSLWARYTSNLTSSITSNTTANMFDSGVCLSQLIEFDSTFPDSLFTFSTDTSTMGWEAPRTQAFKFTVTYVVDISVSSAYMDFHGYFAKSTGGSPVQISYSRYEQDDYTGGGNEYFVTHSWIEHLTEGNKMSYVVNPKAGGPSTVKIEDFSFTVEAMSVTSIAGLTGPAGPQGPTGGLPGADGTGFTGGSYDAGTGTVTFTSDDALGFVTGDLRGADGADGTDGAAWSLMVLKAPKAPKAPPDPQVQLPRSPCLRAECRGTLTVSTSRQETP